MSRAAIRALFQKQGLTPQGFGPTILSSFGLSEVEYNSPATSDADSFLLIRIGAIAEACINELLAECIEPASLGEYLARETSQGRKVAVAAEAGLLTPEFRTWLDAVAALRNGVVHDARRLYGFRFTDHLRTGSGEPQRWIGACWPFLDWIEGPDSAVQRLAFAIEKPRDVLWVVSRDFVIWTRLKVREATP